jgi:hypothetical protein
VSSGSFSGCDSILRVKVDDGRVLHQQLEQDDLPALSPGVVNPHPALQRLVKEDQGNVLPRQEEVEVHGREDGVALEAEVRQLPRQPAEAERRVEWNAVLLLGLLEDRVEELLLRDVGRQQLRHLLVLKHLEPLLPLL